MAEKYVWHKIAWNDYQKWITKYPMAGADFIRWQEYGK